MNQIPKIYSLDKKKILEFGDTTIIKQENLKHPMKIKI